VNSRKIIHLYINYGKLLSDVTSNPRKYQVDVDNLVNIYASPQISSLSLSVPNLHDHNI